MNWKTSKRPSFVESTCREIIIRCELDDTLVDTKVGVYWKNTIQSVCMFHCFMFVRLYMMTFLTVADQYQNNVRKIRVGNLAW